MGNPMEHNYVEEGVVLTQCEKLFNEIFHSGWLLFGLNLQHQMFTSHMRGRLAVKACEGRTQLILYQSLLLV